MKGLYIKLFAIMKTSGNNNNVMYQFISIRLFLSYTSWPAGVFARIQTKKSIFQSVLTMLANSVCHLTV